MKRQKRLSRVISLLLTLALVLSFLPTQALALGSYGEPPDQVAFKVMRMDGIRTVNLLSETNTDGGVTRYTYDKLDRVTSITDPEGAVTRVGYDANSNITKVVQADGKSITYSYDACSQLTSYVDPEGYTFSFTYDGNGSITSSTDGNGNTTRYTYDGLDRITQRTDEEGGVAAQTFDADVNLSVLKIGGSEGWSVIPGPGSLHDRLGQTKGLPPITEMPTVTNVKVVSGK